jgi:hypothetical protein
MRRLKLTSLVLVAAFSVAAAMSSTASALVLPEVLPLATSERAWEGTSAGGTVELKGGEGLKAIACEASTAEGTEETHMAGSPAQGPMHMRLTGCATEGIKCTGLGDSSGVILVLGEFHFYFDKTSPELGLGFVDLWEPFHITCSALILEGFSGDLVCLVLKGAEKSLTHGFHCTWISNGKQEVETYFGSKGEEVTGVSLKCSVNEGVVKPCGALLLPNFKFKEEISFDI